MCNFKQLLKRYWIAIDIALYNKVLLLLLLLLNISKDISKGKRENGM